MFAQKDCCSSNGQLVLIVDKLQECIQIEQLIYGMSLGIDPPLLPETVEINHKYSIPLCTGYLILKTRPRTVSNSILAVLCNKIKNRAKWMEQQQKRSSKQERATPANCSNEREQNWDHHNYLRDLLPVLLNSLINNTITIRQISIMASHLNWTTLPPSWPKLIHIYKSDPFRNPHSRSRYNPI